MVKIKYLLLSGLLLANALSYAAAPANQLLTPQEIQGLQSDDVDEQYEALAAIRDRGVDLAAFDRFLASDPKFQELHERLFLSLFDAIDTLDGALFNYIIRHHPEAINKNSIYGRPLNQVLSKRQFCELSDVPILRTMIKALVNNGANIESADTTGLQQAGPGITTPLMQAVDAGDAEIVTFLLSKGANVNTRNFEGHTALDIARARSAHMPPKYEPVVQLLENYLKSRQENIALQQDRRLPNVAHALIAGYTPAAQSAPLAGLRQPYISALQGSARAQSIRQMLNEIKLAAPNMKVELIRDFITNYPQDLDAQDEAGDSLLLIAIKSGIPAAVRLVLAHLRRLDAQERGVNARLEKALAQKNAYDKNAYSLAIENPVIMRIIRPYYVESAILEEENE